MAMEPPIASSSTTPLHRIRFVDYEPSPITSLSFTPLPLPSPDPRVAAAQAEVHWRNPEPEFGCLIVGRQNGQVDVWEYVAADGEDQHGGWVLDKVLPATLSHPTVSLLALVIREPSVFYDVQNTRRVPRLDELRLFTAGSDSGDLVERCLVTGRILQIYSVPSAPIWSLSVSPTHDSLVLASSSVNLHFLSLSSSYPLIEPSSPTHRSEPLPGRTRTLSIAWGPPARIQLPTEFGEEETRWSWRNQYIVTGNSDSSLRKWNVQTGRVIGRMAVNKARKEKKKGPARSSIVWSVGVLGDHTVISADSMGAVTFWDGASMAQVQSFQTHAADAMCMTIGPGGKSVYTSGPDQKIAQFTLVGSSSGTSGKSAGKWIRTAFKRMHVHDVRALAIFPPYVAAPTAAVPVNLAYAPVLASGGWDMQVVLSPASTPDLLAGGERKNPIARSIVTNFSDSTQRRLQMVQAGRGLDVITFSKRARLVLCRRYRSVGIWRVRTPQGLDDDQAGWAKVLEMDFQLRTSLTAAALSEDGSWLAVADMFETKLYRLREDPDAEDSLIPKRVRDFSETLIEFCEDLPLEERGTGAVSLTFTPDSNRLIVGLSLTAAMVVVELGKESSNDVQVSKVFPVNAQETGVGAKAVNAPKINGRASNGHANGHVNGSTAMDVDEDDSSSVAGGSGDDSDSYEEDSDASVADSMARATMMSVSEDGQWLACADSRRQVNVYNLDVLKLHCTLPSFAQAPIAMTFVSDRALVLALPASNRLEAFDVESLRLCREILPAMDHFAKQVDSVLGLSYQPLSSKIVAYGQSWIGAVEVKKDVMPPTLSSRTKRRRSRQIEAEATDATEEGFARVMQGYRQATGLAVFGNEILLVERPFTDLRKLPPAFTTAKYGT